jgi:hypothetical protein
MSIVHNVEIVWDELVDAFTSGESNRLYFLDRYTGEIFFIPTSREHSDLWGQLDNGQGRFLEIPRMDYGLERRLLFSFVSTVTDREARELLTGLLAGDGPYGNLTDVLAFFPEEEERLTAMKDEFLARRLHSWLEENDLFTDETETVSLTRQ